MPCWQRVTQWCLHNGNPHILPYHTLPYHAISYNTIPHGAELALLYIFILSLIATYTKYCSLAPSSNTSRSQVSRVELQSWVETSNCNCIVWKSNCGYFRPATNLSRPRIQPGFLPHIIPQCQTAATAKQHSAVQNCAEDNETQYRHLAKQ